jgi:ABC-type branched-subunit amino acid transport system substrate-binding protein
MRKLLFVNLLLIFCITQLPLAQDSAQREYALLLKNIELYKQGRYKKAEQNFALVIARLPGSKLLTINYLMLTKSKYKQKDYSGAINMCKEYESKFYNSKYRDDILLVMGNSYYNLDRFETAIKIWINAISVSEDERLKDNTGYLVTKTLRYKLDTQTLSRLQNEIDTRDGQMLLNIALAENDLKRGMASSANKLLTNALAKYAGSSFDERAKGLLKTGEIGGTDIIRFALLLPLSGENHEIGNALKDGVEFALQEFEEQNGLNVQLIIKDYGQEITKALRYYKELSQNKTVLAVFGPLENDISAACAALSEYEKLLILSPTASDPELTGLTDYFYQLNSTIDLRAENLAYYAIDSLQITRFATFSPIDNHFVRMVDKFVETVTTLGGEVIDQEWYYPGDQDFSKQFMSLKRKGLKFSFGDSVLQANPELNENQIDSLYKAYIEIEKEVLKEADAKIDSADIPVTSIGGIFIPIFREDLPFMAPQIAYSNIQSQFFGNDDWYDMEPLKKNKNYINGIIFVSDGFINEESWDYRKFRNDFRTKTQKTPTFYNIIGYDSFNYMLKAVKNSSVISRNTYIKNLQNISSYNGIYRSILMTEDNYNRKLQLLKYSYGQIIPLNQK